MESGETAGLEANAKKTKQPPKFKRKERSKKEIAKAQARAQRLEREKDQAVAKLKELEELLDKLPEIFESKFTQRLAPVLERQRLLLEENLHLRAQVERLMSQLSDVRLEFPQAQSRHSVAFIGLKPASTSSLQPLTEKTMGAPIATEVAAPQQRLNCA